MRVLIVPKSALIPLTNALVISQLTIVDPCTIVLPDLMCKSFKVRRLIVFRAGLLVYKTLQHGQPQCLLPKCHVKSTKTLHYYKIYRLIAKCTQNYRTETGKTTFSVTGPRF